MTHLHTILSLSYAVTYSVQSQNTPVVVPGWPLDLPFLEQAQIGIRQCMPLAIFCNLWISGMQGIDFTSRPPKLVRGGVVNETRQALTNIRAITEAVNSSMDSLSDCTIMLSDSLAKDAFTEMNKEYTRHFGPVKPTRATFFIQIVGDALVEIKCNGYASADITPLRQQADPREIAAFPAVPFDAGIVAILTSLMLFSVWQSFRSRSTVL